ncbi:MAG: hypothetical protein K6C36_01170 [Clostridia bacterium]|nr:hypothetical protein [Clostridia bacterium]
MEMITMAMVYIQYFLDIFHRLLSALMKGYGVEDSDVADITWPWASLFTTTAPADEAEEP